MANRQILKYDLKTLENFQTWKLVVIFIIMLFVSATFLRLNNIGMVNRRQAVINADKTGDVEATRDRLIGLADYVRHHMNTSQNEVYLKGQYNRDKAKLVQAAADSNTTDNISAKADAICKPKFSGFSQAYVQCVAKEYAKYSPGSVSPITQISPPDPEKYRHVYASPLWSPDFAGFSVLITFLVLFIIILRFISLIFLKLVLKMTNKSF